MKIRHSSENVSAAPAAIARLSEATRRASSGSFAPSRRTIRLPPPTPNRLAMDIVIRNTVSTSDEAATM